MEKPLRSVVIAILCVGLLMVPTGAGVAGAAKAAGNLNLGVIADVKNLNPYMGYGSSETFVIGWVYDTLLGWDSNEGLVPGLADSWEIKDGGTSVEFKLNPNAKWHDGKPVTAEDVEFSFNFIREKRFPSFMAIIGNLAGAKAIDKHTVRVTFRSPSSNAVRFIATAPSILPKHIWSKIDDPRNYPNLDNPIGCGPCAVAERRDGQFITLKNLGNHYRSSLNVETITLRVLRDETMGIMALRRGDLDALLWSVDPAVAEEIDRNPKGYPNVKVAMAPSTSVRTLMFNLRRAPWNDATLRKAVSLAINQKELIDQVLLGYGSEQGPGLVVPSDLHYNKALGPVPRDVAKAKAILDQAGYVDKNRDGIREDKNGKPIKLEILTGNLPTSINLAELLVYQIKQIGIDAYFTPLTAESLRNKEQAADFDAAVSSVSFSVPDMMFYYAHTSRGVINEGRVAGFNYGGYSNPEYDKLAEAMLVEMNDQARIKLLRDMQAKLAEAYYHIPLFSSNVLMLYRDDRFTGWTVEPDSCINNSTTYSNLVYKGGK